MQEFVLRDFDHFRPFFDHSSEIVDFENCFAYYCIRKRNHGETPGQNKKEELIMKKRTKIPVKIIVATFGILACIALFHENAAASGLVDGYYDGYPCYAYVTNYNHWNCYCFIALMQGDGAPTSTVSSNSGVVGYCGNVEASGYITMQDAFASGCVYNGAHPNSGVNYSNTIPIINHLGK